MAEILSVSRRSVKKVRLLTVADLVEVLQDMRTRFQYCQVGIRGGSRKSCPFLYFNLLNKNEQDIWNIQ